MSCNNNLKALFKNEVYVTSNNYDNSSLRRIKSYNLHTLTVNTGIRLFAQPQNSKRMIL